MKDRPVKPRSSSPVCPTSCCSGSSRLSEKIRFRKVAMSAYVFPATTTTQTLGNLTRTPPHYQLPSGRLVGSRYLMTVGPRSESQGREQRAKTSLPSHISSDP